jgi:mRNA interferase MazF
MNDSLGTIAVMAITSGSRPARFRVATSFRNVPGFLLGDQIRSVSKSRLLKRLGLIDAESMSAALAMLRDMFEE